MRTIRLHPTPEVAHDCPHCSNRLEVLGWKIPGMRALADLHCSTCQREYYGDLGMGQALYTPMLLERATGVVYDRNGVDWFADWLRESYAKRSSEPLSFVVEKRRPVTRKVVLLNCLDTLYGHCLLKLLNAQYYLDKNVDLILLVPSFLAWLVPEGVAEVWTVELPLRRGTEWNERLAAEIQTRAMEFESVDLSIAMSHPAAKDYDIERFTGVKPFPLDEWSQRLDQPTVTFIWRDDRTWSLKSRAGRLLSSSSLKVQQKLVVELAEALRAQWPALDFGVAGLSKLAQPLPSWIKDLRLKSLNSGQERSWCERYSNSHVVIGLHGSNMLLPTGHAGALVELIGPERYGNFTQDVLFRETGDSREMFFRSRFLSPWTTPQEVAEVVSLQLRGYEPFKDLMNKGADIP